MPLTTAEKLKIKPGSVLFTINAPEDFASKLGPVGKNIQLVTKGKSYDQVHWFVTNRAELDKTVEKVISLLTPGILLWIYYPKGSSGVQTDLTRDKGWDSLLRHEELSWINLISFDDTWAAFASRLKTDKDRQRAARPAEKPVNEYIDAKSRTVKTPPDLARALKGKKAAEEFFNSLAYSHKKEYVEWIVTAKKDETRAARVQGTVERLLKSWKNPRNL